jgi:hypothetical protein
VPALRKGGSAMSWTDTFWFWVFVFVTTLVIGLVGLFLIVSFVNWAVGWAVG